jgi:hypothetical protein
MKIFILQAKGLLGALDGPGKIICKKAFKSSAAAKAYVPIFRKECITPKDENDLRYLQDNDNLKFFIGEVDLED